jgi:hypothetical protein
MSIFINVGLFKLPVLYLQFHRTFCVTAQSTDRGSFVSNLAFAIQDRVGTAEEVLNIIPLLKKSAAYVIHLCFHIVYEDTNNPFL